MEKKETLLGFIAFLNERLGFSFDKNNFDHRMKLQKYVSIAKFFGLNLGYHFSLYIRGPYSPMLAADYYKIDHPIKPDAIDFEGFDSKKFLKIVKGKDSRWLEIVSTVLSVRDRNTGIDRKNLVKIVAEIKHVDAKFVDEVLMELESLG